MRRSAIRNFRKAGVSESDGMKISGHKTNSVYKRYDIMDEEDQRRTIEKVQEDINAGNWRTSRWFPSSARGNSDNIRAKGTFS
jgi:hypothetical protein